MKATPYFYKHYIGSPKSYNYCNPSKVAVAFLAKQMHYKHCKAEHQISYQAILNEMPDPYNQQIVSPVYARSHVYQHVNYSPDPIHSQLLNEITVRT